MKVERLEQIATPMVNKFYQAHKVRGRANKQDEVWVVKCPYIVAACRVQNRAGALFLSTLFVVEQYRSQGIAKQIILEVLSQHTQPIFTFAYTHLEAFYRSVKFTSADALPDELAGMLNAYRQQGRNIIAMKYKPEWPLRR